MNKSLVHETNKVRTSLESLHNDVLQEEKRQERIKRATSNR